VNLNEVPPPNKQVSDEKFISKEPPYLEHALDEEDFTSPRKQPKEESYEEGYQPLEEEKELPHDSIEENEDFIEEREPQEVNHEEYYQEEHEFPCECVKEEHFGKTHFVKDLIHEETPHEDEALIFSPPSSEVMQASIPPSYEEKNVVSFTPFQVFDFPLLCDSESEEVLEDTLNALHPSCYNESDVEINNIYEFGRCKWDVIGSGLHEDPIYDTEGHFKLFSLEKPYMISTDSDTWQHEDDMIAYFFQPPKDDLVQHSYDYL
jgi:hypothetical protein